MKSPFPGMDPFIEASGLWEDFHAALIADIKNALSLSVPERYVVRFGERSYVVLVDTEGRQRHHPFLPDVRINAPNRPTLRAGSGMAVAEPAAESGPLLMTPFIEQQFREAFVDVYDTDPEFRLVTSIEVLSPSNKRRGSTGWELYLRKRQSLLLGSVHLVEIDFLRGGERMPMAEPWPDSPYTVLAYRTGVVPQCRVWRVGFRQPVPAVEIPLASPDPDVALAIQPMIDTIYARSRYYRNIDYSRPPTPPLSPEDATWLEQQLRSRSA
jgi:hypothetical protein